MSRHILSLFTDWAWGRAVAGRGEEAEGMAVASVTLVARTVPYRIVSSSSDVPET